MDFLQVLQLQKMVSPVIDEHLVIIILLSLKVAFVAILFATPVAVMIGYILARWRFPGHFLLNALTYLPLVLPPVVTGYLLLNFFGPQGMGGQFFSNVFGLEFGFRWSGAALAAGVVAFPLIVRPIKLAFETVEQDLVDDANILGASRSIVFLTIFLPLALPGIVAGAVLGFAKALVEFGATITFVSNIPGETQTFSLAIYSFLQNPDGDQAAFVLVVITIAVSLLTVVVSEFLSRKLYAGQGR